MDKPRKKELLADDIICHSEHDKEIHNRVCNEWEAFLPNMEDLVLLMRTALWKTREDIDCLTFKVIITNKDLRNFAKVIARRIGK